MHDLEFCVLEMFEEIAFIKLEDEEVEDKEGKGNTNVNATTSSDAVPTLHSFTHEQHRQAFWLTASQVFKNTIIII